MKLSRKLGQEFTIITCDQAIYEIVLGLQKKKPQKYAEVVIRMGVFHIAQNFLGAIGHLMQATGIEDIMVEANGTANKIISGKHYCAMLWARSLVHATMFVLHWESFERWLMDEGKDLECLSKLAYSIQLLLDALSEADVEKSAASTEASELLTEVSRLTAVDSFCSFYVIVSNTNVNTVSSIKLMTKQKMKLTTNDSSQQYGLRLATCGLWAADKGRDVQ